MRIHTVLKSPLRNTTAMMARGKETAPSDLGFPGPHSIYPIRRAHISIMGGHGVGKTTVALGLWDLLTGGMLIDDCRVSDFADDNRINAHAYHDVVLMLGKYGLVRKCGGMDSIPTADDRLYCALDAAFASRTLLTIGEGALINSMKMMAWFDEHAVIYNRDVVVIHLTPMEDVQFARIEGRSGKKRSDLVGNGKHVIRKNEQFVRVMDWITENSVHISTINVSCRFYITDLLRVLVDALQSLYIIGGYTK